MFKKHFTPHEANLRLPLVKAIVADILEKGKKARMIMASSAGEDDSPEISNIQEDIEVLMGELEQLGCYYKDWNFEIGLVDFPAIINGREVLLCWRSDESIVRWYHDAQDGYAGRKLIPEDLLDS
jgi:hypothetical protein